MDESALKVSRKSYMDDWWKTGKFETNLDWSEHRTPYALIWNIKVPYETLPSEWVMKTNGGSGSNLFFSTTVANSNSWVIDEAVARARQKFDSNLKKNDYQILKWFL